MSGTFRVTIALEGAALTDDQPRELGRILHVLAEAATDDLVPARVYDTDGNDVGGVELHEDDRAAEVCERARRALAPGAGYSATTLLSIIRDLLGLVDR